MFVFFKVKLDLKGNVVEFVDEVSVICVLLLNGF